MTDSAIFACNLKKTFVVGFRRQKVPAVVDVSFDVHRGEIFGIVGPNGAGKTTTIKMLTGLVRPDVGTIAILGQDVHKVSTRRAIGYLPENPYFYEHLKVKELLEFHGQLHGIDADLLRKRIPELIERVGLTHANDRRIGRFSKGMRQRAGIAQALINDPEVVILDEPQSGLDPFGRREVRDLIFQLKQEGKTVLLCSHILPDVEAVCDRVAVVHRGIVRDVGTLAQLTGMRVKAYEVIASGVKHLPESAVLKQVQGDTQIIEANCEEALQRCLRELMDQGSKILSVATRKEDLEDVFVRDTDHAKQ